MNARRVLLSVLVGLAGSAALMPAVARSGTYVVRSCSIDGGFFGSAAWTASVSPAGTPGSVDAPCTSAVNTLTARLADQNTFAPGSSAGVVFSAPGGAYISDYTLRVHQKWYAPGAAADGSRDETTYNLISLGDAAGRDQAVSGGGQYEPAQRDQLRAEGHWYGFDPATGRNKSFDVDDLAVSRGTSPAAQSVSRPTEIDVRVGCWSGAPGGCTLGRAGNPSAVFTQLYGSRVTVHDDTKPDLSGPTAGQGLLAPGTRSGDEPVTFSGTDNVGIRRAELVDVTDASRPSVVAAKDYDDGTLTAQRRRCDFTGARPCPDLRNETLAADPPIAGRRTLLVRVTDAAGNESNTAPFAVVARGAVNGANGGDGARLTAGFPAKVYRRSKAGKRYYTYVVRPSRTVSYGRGASLRGILRNAGGQPITGAELRILVRENRIGAQYVDRGALTTGADGRFTLGVPAGSSRTYQLAYRAYRGDDGLAARSKSTLNTRARITARAPRRVRGRGTARFRGTLVGRPLPRRGVTLELQAFQPRRGWRTVATARTGRAGRYSVRYKFNSPRGSFRFRVRLRPNDAYPYARGNSRRLRVRVG